VRASLGTAGGELFEALEGLKTGEEAVITLDIPAGGVLDWGTQGSAGRQGGDNSHGGSNSVPGTVLPAKKRLSKAERKRLKKGAAGGVGGEAAASCSGKGGSSGGGGAEQGMPHELSSGGTASAGAMWLGAGVLLRKGRRGEVEIRSPVDRLCSYYEALETLR